MIIESALAFQAQENCISVSKSFSIEQQRSSYTSSFWHFYMYSVRQPMLLMITDLLVSASRAHLV